MRESDWRSKKRIETEYTNNMMKIAKSFFGEAMDRAKTAEEQLEILRSAASKPMFMEWARTVAQRMVTGLSVTNAKNWKEAATEGMESNKIHQMLATEMQTGVGRRVNELVQQNAELISSLPIEVAQQVNRVIQKGVMQGKRAAEINKLLRNTQLVKKLTMRRIALISRTETSKVSTALTRARSEDIGADWYIWRTSKDARVRISHNKMDRVLVNWNEAPSPEALVGESSSLGHYHAGDAPNCRCYPQPILNLNDVRWPTQVYYSGRVQYMNRSAFKKLFAAQEAA